MHKVASPEFLLATNHNIVNQQHFLPTFNSQNSVLQHFRIISIMGNIPCCDQSKKANEPQVKIRSETRNHHHNTFTPIINAQSSQKNIKVHSSIDGSKPEIKDPIKYKGSRGPENYQSKKYLGKGAFGCVVQAEDKETGKLYAMKIIQKAKIKEFNVLQCQLIKRIGHQDFLISIRETFQNQTNIYIIMQYLPKGDLYFYLKRKEIPFTETMIRGIIAEIVVGMGYIHKYGLIYRQLKPENLLITSDGHIKLTDFGLSKVIIEDKKQISTFVGTLEYMPPQALDGQFGQKADIWALGVLMYELLFRQNPFEGDERRLDLSVDDYRVLIDKNSINEKINSKIGYMSLSFRDLLLKLLQKIPEKRITLEQIKQHDFFKQTNWQSVQSRTNEPPLSQIIQKHDFINYRDPTSEQYIRKAYAKHRNICDNYNLQLYQFRNSH